MKSVNIILDISARHNIGHTTARKEATDLGARYYSIYTDVSEDFLSKPISLLSLNIIKRQTDKPAEMLTRAKVARLTTPHGTDLTMSLEGREGVPIHPLTDAPITAVPDYGEAAIAPVEGTTEGVVVVDASVRGWG